MPLFFHSQVGGAVKSCVGWIVHVRIDLAAFIEKKVMLYPVRRCAQMQACLTDRFR